MSCRWIYQGRQKVRDWHHDGSRRLLDLIASGYLQALGAHRVEVSLHALSTSRTGIQVFEHLLGVRHCGNIAAHVYPLMQRAGWARSNMP